MFFSSTGRVNAPQSESGDQDAVAATNPLTFGPLLLVVVIVAVIAAFGLSHGFDAFLGAYVPPAVTVTGVPAIAELQAKNAVQYQEKLEGYGVVDQAKGVYKIPIERAMELVGSDQRYLQNPLD